MTNPTIGKLDEIANSIYTDVRGDGIVLNKASTERLKESVIAWALEIVGEDEPRHANMPVEVMAIYNGRNQLRREIRSKLENL